jgi:hypothetical protein
MGDAGGFPQTERTEPSHSRDVASGKRRRRSKRARKSRHSHWRLRIVYFGIASIWGFIMGTAAVLGALSMLDLQLPEDPTITLMVALAAIAAVVGGAITAMAYRDAVGRRQR